MQVPHKEHLYKLLVIGDLGVGKTSIIKRYVHQNFSSHYRATIGVDFALKVLHWDPETVVRLQLWDIAGEPRGRELGRGHLADHLPGQGSGSSPRGDPGLPPRRCAARDFSGWTANLRFRRNKKFLSSARQLHVRSLALCGGCFLSLPQPPLGSLGSARASPGPRGRPSGIALGSGSPAHFPGTGSPAGDAARSVPPFPARCRTPEGKPLDRLTAGTWRVPD